MISLLYIKIFKVFVSIIRNEFLPIGSQLVKIIVLGHIFSQEAWALSDSNYVNIPKSQYILSIGEYLALPFSNSNSFAVSNKEIIKVKLKKGNKQLLIRAKHLGTSELTIWKSKEQIKVTFLVVSKSSQEKLKGHLKLLNKYKLRASISSSKISISSEIEDLSHLEKILAIHSERKDLSIKLSNEINLSKSLKQKLTAQVYDKLIQEEINPISCSFKTIPLRCLIEKSSHDLKALKDYWFQKYQIKFITQDKSINHLNYKLRTKIILLETADASSVDLGLSSISTQVSNILDKDFNSLISNNEVSLNSKDIEISSISAPDIIISPGIKGEISLGSEIPFSNKNGEDYYTEWKFAGLKIIPKIKKNGDSLHLEISTELSKPNSNRVRAISANKLKTSLKVVPDTTYKIADIFHRGNTLESSSVSYISQLPILGRLFSNNNKMLTHKYISIYINLEELTK